jgi:hypothetical protein
MIQFMFTTSPVDENFLETLRLQEGEIEDAKFVAISELPNHFSQVRAKTVIAYYQHRNGKNAVYLENGDVIA